jgi:hypothetical protein
LREITEIALLLPLNIKSQTPIDITLARTRPGFVNFPRR